MDPTSVAAAGMGARVWKAIGGGGIIRSLLAPWQIKREGMASVDVKVKERLALAQAEVDVQAILDGKKSYSVDQWRLISHDTSNQYQQPTLDVAGGASSSLASSTADILIAERIKREINVAQAALIAEELLEADVATQPETEPSEDWVTRWRDSAERVSDAQMQELWGRILAGEIRKPGAYSLRALETVKNLSREDADLISKLANFWLGDFVVKFADASYFDQQGLRFSELLELQELGVIAGVESLGIEKTFSLLPGSGNTRAIAFSQHVLLVTPPEGSDKFSIPIYGVTRLGRQIMSLAEQHHDLRYIGKIKELLIEAGCKATVHLVINRLPDNRVAYTDAEVATS